MTEKRKAGRKPVDDKVKRVMIYTKTSRIEKLGIDTIQEISDQAIEKEYKKQVKKLS